MHSTRVGTSSVDCCTACRRHRRHSARRWGPRSLHSWVTMGRVGPRIRRAWGACRSSIACVAPRLWRGATMAATPLHYSSSHFYCLVSMQCIASVAAKRQLYTHATAAAGSCLGALGTLFGGRFQARCLHSPICCRRRRQQMGHTRFILAMLCVVRIALATPLGTHGVPAAYTIPRTLTMAVNVILGWCPGQLWAMSHGKGNLMLHHVHG